MAELKMVTASSVPQIWADAFKKYFTKSPYVGPRPQTSYDKGMLVGRDREIKHIARAVLDRQLVVLDGYSGTGKSSLLQNGVVERLENYGFKAFTVSSWGNLPKKASVADIDDFIAKAINTRIEDGETSICCTLDKIYGEEKTVLVLDQFEEMLRQHEKPLLNLMGEWIVSSIYQSRIHIVISLRTDSLHRLEPLLRGVRPFSQERLHIEEISQESDIELIISQTQEWCGDQEVIELEASDRILNLWKEHLPSLLCLQACLFALFFRAQDRGQQRGIEEKAVPIAFDDVLELENIDPNQDLFSNALQDAIRIRIAQAESAAEEAQLDKYLVTGARELVRRMPPLLSSGDHKVPMLVSELAFRVLADELRVLRGSLLEENGWHNDKDIPSKREFLSKIIKDILESIRNAKGYIFPDITETTVITEVTAGPMMGKSATETLRWELERFVLAITWLIDSKLLREDSNGMLMLIHDGAGAALNSWSDAEETDFLSATRRITGARGERFYWIGNPVEYRNADDPLKGKRGDPKFLFNLSWRECRITANISHVVFVNCDFTASKFNKCEFEGVTFINCNLDDANFEECKILGEAQLEFPISDTSRKGIIKPPPSFTIEAPLEYKNFKRYVGCNEGGVFFSETTGAAAVLMESGPEDLQNETLANIVAPSRIGSRTDQDNGQIRRDTFPVEGGVAIVGGRICFLTLYQCEANKKDEPALILHSVAGHGLDLIDFSGFVSIYDSAIRGVSVSSDSEEQKSTIRVETRGSMIANTSFSDHLRGSASFIDCTVFCMLNANEHHDLTEQLFTVELMDCRYQFIANVNLNDENSIEDSKFKHDQFRYFNHWRNTHSRCALENQGLLAFMLNTMDFHRRPEEWGRRQRELYPVMKARMLLRMVSEGWDSLPKKRRRVILEEGTRDYKQALGCVILGEREELRLQSEATLIGYLLLIDDYDNPNPQSTAPNLVETLRVERLAEVKKLAAEMDYKKIEDWAEANIIKTKPSDFAGQPTCE